MSETHDLIKHLRETHGLTQSEIAKRTLIPQSRLSRWEAGAVPAAADDALKLQALADALVRGKKRVRPVVYSGS